MGFSQPQGPVVGNGHLQAGIVDFVGGHHHRNPALFHDSGHALIIITQGRRAIPTTNKTASAPFTAASACSRTSLEKGEEASSSQPPVSTTKNWRSAQLALKMRRSRVTPGWDWTTAARRPMIRLIRVDLLPHSGVPPPLPPLNALQTYLKDYGFGSNQLRTMSFRR